VTGQVSGFVSGFILEKAPEAERFMEWLMMSFSFGVGTAIGKFSIAYEDKVNVLATAIIGAYVQLQMFCSLGFDFTSKLSIAAAVDGEMGCDSLACNVTLCVFIFYGVCGVYNQFRMEKVMAKMEADPEFQGSGRHERLLVTVNTMFAILFALNDLIKSEGEYHTEDEIKELEKKKKWVLLQLSTVASDVGLAVISFTMITSIAEGFALGCFPWEAETGFKRKAGSHVLFFFASLLGLLAVLSGLLAVFVIKTHLLPKSEQDKILKRLNLHLWFGAVLIPLSAACALVILVMLNGDISVPLVQIPQARKFFEIDQQTPQVQAALNEHLPVLYGSLQGLSAMLVVSWIISCKKLGGVLFLYHLRHIIILIGNLD
jgi:hypothetical protein